MTQKKNSKAARGGESGADYRQRSAGTGEADTLS